MDSPREPSADGSETELSMESSSGESGVYRFPKSNVSETGDFDHSNYDGQGKSKAQETYDSMFIIAYTWIAMLIFFGVGFGAYLIWGR